MNIKNWKIYIFGAWYSVWNTKQNVYLNDFTIQQKNETINSNNFSNFTTVNTALTRNSNSIITDVKLKHLVCFCSFLFYE